MLFSSEKNDRKFLIGGSILLFNHASLDGGKSKKKRKTTTKTKLCNFKITKEFVDHLAYITNRSI